jgi:NADP-dependent 3-hydroxy acid dehydrogenase YdfG
MVKTEFSEVRLGDADRAKAVYEGKNPLIPEDIAEAVLWAVQRPTRVNIQEMVIYPTEQSGVHARPQVRV